MRGSLCLSAVGFLGCTLFGTLACGDSTGTGGTGGAGGGEGLSAPQRVCIDSEALTVVPPAGIQVRFRVLDDTGSAVRPLTEKGDVVIINDEKDEPFGTGNEGSAVSDLGAPAALKLYSALVLDMSDSIVNKGLQDAVINGARAYIQQVIEEGNPDYPHAVSIIVFGSPDLTKTLVPFTTSLDELYGELEKLRDEPSLGTTDLYGAYIDGLNALDSQVVEGEVNERLLVLISDGTHEAGATSALRSLALERKHSSGATKLTIGIQGNYDPCGLEELAGAAVGACNNPLKGCREGITCTNEVDPPASCTQFQGNVSPDDLEAAFTAFAQRAEGIAQSNYVVGVCTPIAIGNNASLTIRVDVDGATDAATLNYPTDKLTGALSECNVEEVKNFVDPAGSGGTGGSGGASGGGGAGGAGGAAGGAGGVGGAGGAGGMP